MCDTPSRGMGLGESISLRTQIVLQPTCRTKRGDHFRGPARGDAPRDGRNDGRDATHLHEVSNTLATGGKPEAAYSATEAERVRRAAMTSFSAACASASEGD